MTPAWNDATYPMLSPWQAWRRRLAQRVRCYFHAHTVGLPQRHIGRPDVGLSYGPCRYCGGEHLWRGGQWVAQRV